MGSQRAFHSSPSSSNSRKTFSKFFLFLKRKNFCKFWIPSFYFLFPFFNSQNLLFSFLFLLKKEFLCPRGVKTRNGSRTLSQVLDSSLSIFKIRSKQAAYLWPSLFWSQSIRISSCANSRQWITPFQKTFQNSGWSFEEHEPSKNSASRDGRVCFFLFLERNFFPRFSLFLFPFLFSLILSFLLLRFPL